MTQKEAPPLALGAKPIATTSSVLVSSSKYLDDAGIREHLAFQALRKIGPDYPSYVGAYQWYELLKPYRNEAEVDAMFRDAAKDDDALAAWLDAGFYSHYRLEDLKDHPPGTLGAAFYGMMASRGFAVDYLHPFEPKGPYDLYILRAAQTHDIEHLLSGLPAHGPGETGILMMGIANRFQHLPAALAGAIAKHNAFLLLPTLMRIMLHYPHGWPVYMEFLEQGAKVGRESGPVWMNRYEDLFPLPIDEARERAGFRGVREIDVSHIIDPAVLSA